MYTLTLTEAQYSDLIYGLHNLRALLEEALPEALTRGNTNDAEIISEEKQAADELLEAIYHQVAKSAIALPF